MLRLWSTSEQTPGDKEDERNAVIGERGTGGIGRGENEERKDNPMYLAEDWGWGKEQLGRTAGWSRDAQVIRYPTGVTETAGRRQAQVM